MEKKIEERVYGPEEVESKEILDDLSWLFMHNLESGDDYYEIHIFNRGQDTIVQYVLINNLTEEEPKFKLID